jgi:3-hydroxyanthranilate 3,4-dioxygenase
MLLPFNLMQFIEEHKHLLKPPVNNKVLFESESFVVMVVGGPNARKDYHINQSEELFYQIQGQMLLKIKNPQGHFQDITISEGEIFLLPARIPHSPQRLANTIGLVIEKKRLASENDSLVWYCEKCLSTINSKSFFLTNIEIELKNAINEHFADAKNYTCKKCGHLNEKN